MPLPHPNWPPPLRSADAVELDLVAAGEASLDVVGRLDGPVPPDGKARLGALDLLPGGQAATVAVGVRRLGWRASYLGVLGDDDWGARVLAALAREGVTARVTRRSGSSSRAALVLVDERTGHRAVLEHRSPALDWEPGECPVDAALAGRLLALDTSDPSAARHLAHAARRAGVPTILDLDRLDPAMTDLAASVDIVVMPEAIARQIGGGEPGDGLRHLLAGSTACLGVATLGHAGSLARSGDLEIRTPALPVDVVDTTGAGDGFRAGLIAAWLEAPAAPDLPHLLRVANAVAGLNCRRTGAQAALPTRTELAAVL